MFPFGIFPFNVLAQFNPWWPVQAQKLEESTPPLVKEYLDSCAAWSELMSKGNPWLTAYNKMLENGPLTQSPFSKKS